MSSAQMQAATKAKLELGSKARTGGCPGTEPWTQSQGPCMSAPCRVSHQSQGRQGQTSQRRAVPPITKGRVISGGPGAVQAGGAGPAAQGGLWRGQQEPGLTGPALAGSSCQARPRLQPRSYAMGKGTQQPGCMPAALCPSGAQLGGACQTWTSQELTGNAGSLFYLRWPSQVHGFLHEKCPGAEETGALLLLASCCCPGLASRSLGLFWGWPGSSGVSFHAWEQH